MVRACNAAAAHLGIRPGHSAGAALALAPDLVTAARDVDAEARILRELANRAIRFTPTVHLDTLRPAGKHVAETGDSLLLEVQGSLRLFGGLDRLRRAVQTDFAERAHGFVSTVAPTARAALWLARAGSHRVVCDRAALPGSLGALPVDCLGWPVDVLRTLSGIGVSTIGECIRLPRDGLARRIGSRRLAELDEGFGARPEVRVPHRPPRFFDETLDLPAETTDIDLLLAALRALLDRLQDFLRRLQGATRVIWIELGHRGLPATLERIGLLRPSMDAAYLFELARLRFDALRIDAPVISLRLRSALAPLPSAPAIDLLGQRSDAAADSLVLVEQLRVRLGPRAVHGVRPVAEHRPEAAWQAVEPQVAKAPRAGDESQEIRPSRHRPVWMLAEPRALRVREGRPLLGGALHLEGDPERIETGWWDGNDIRRDYYVARDRHGTRLWVFRDRRRSRWYLHGFFG